MVIQITKTKNIFLFHKVSELDIALSIKHFATMLKSGLALEQIIKILSEQDLDLKLSHVYKEILKNVKDGKSLYESMKTHRGVFSDVIISIIKIGEEGGTLENNLLFLSDYLRKNYELNKKVKGAMIYPTVVFVITIIEMIGVAFFILPRLQNVFASFKNTPPATIFIINLASSIRENILLIGVITALCIILFKVFLWTKAGKYFKDFLSLNFPVFKKLNKYNILARFSRTLGILLQSGIPLIEALQIAKGTTSNIFYTKSLNNIHKEVHNGNSIAKSMLEYSKYFPVTYSKMIEVAEESATLEDNLMYLYEFYSEEVKNMSNNMATLIEPLLMIFIGVMVGALALFVILPIYQLIGTINA